MKARLPAPREWGFTIEADAPLDFKEQVVRGVRLRADLFCDVRWRDPAAGPTRQNLVLRVWATDRKVCVRDDLDHAAVEARLDPAKGRVMVRYHFDRANDGQSGPLHHLQAGGNARADEVCWLHEAVSVPRLCHPPLDLPLACEVVVANFLADSASVLRDPTWMGVIRSSQEELLRPYFTSCLKALDGKETVLRSLWNIPL